MGKLFEFLAQWVLDYVMDIVQEGVTKNCPNVLELIGQHKLRKGAIKKIEGNIDTFKTYYTKEHGSEDDVIAFLEDIRPILDKIDMDFLIQTNFDDTILFNKLIELIGKDNRITANQLDSFNMLIGTISYSVINIAVDVLANPYFFNLSSFKVNVHQMKLLQEIIIKLNTENIEEAYIPTVTDKYHPVVLFNLIYNNLKVKKDYMFRQINFIQEKSDFKSDIEIPLRLPLSVEEFMYSSSWKNNLINEMTGFASNHQSFNNLLANRCKKLRDEIDSTNLDYITIKQKLVTFIDSLKVDLKQPINQESLNRLKKSVHRFYGKVLIIKGDRGSGKTFILSKILNNYTKQINSKELDLIIPINIQYILEGHNWGDALVKSIRDIINVEFTSIDQINILINKLNSYKIRAKFILDDFQKIYFYSPKKARDLTEEVKRLTKYDWITWVITLSSNGICCIEDSNFWREYAYRQHKTYNDLCIGIDDLYVDLDELNLNNKTGLKIIQQYVGDVGETKIIDLFDELNKQNKILYNPMLAHIYSISVSESEKKVLNTYCFKFIKKYAQYVEKQLIASSNLDVPQEDITSFIRENLIKLVEFLSSNQIDSIDEEVYGEYLQQNIEFFKILLGATLIEKKNIKPANDKYNILPSRNIYLLLQEVYWAYQIVLINNEINKLNTDNNIVLYNSFREISSEALIVYILYLYEENKSEEIRNTINKVLSTNNKEVLFFAAENLSDRHKQYILYMISNNDFFDLPTRIELVSLLYFCTLGGFNLEQLGKMIVNLFTQIKEKDLTLHLNYVFKNVLENIEGVEELYRFIVPFLSCQYEEISNALGKMAAEKFALILENDRIHLSAKIEQILGFINNNEVAINTAFENVRGTGKCTFCEYFLKYIYKNLIRESCNMDIFDIFINKRFYFLEGTKGYILRQYLNIEYGNYYRIAGEPFKEMYIYRVYGLLRKGGEHKLKIAFHLIQNTLNDERSIHEHVDKRFCGALKIISKCRADNIKEFILQPSIADFLKRNTQTPK